MLASHVDEDHRFLKRVFDQRRWYLIATRTVEGALSLLQRYSIPVVVTERDLPGGGWKAMLAGLEHLRRAPLLVVASRLADDYLWAEALNLGAHDVIAKPFRTSELEWVLENAWRRWGAAPEVGAFAAGRD